MPEIKLYTKDIENIANNRRQGGGSHTILEVCLARKVLELQKTIKEINDRNNGIFDTIYHIHSIINRKYGSQIIRRTMNDATAAANKIFIAPPYLDKREKPLTEKGNDNAEHT